MSIRDAAASYVTKLITNIQLQGVPTVVSRTNLPFMVNLLLSLCVCGPDTEAVRVLVLDIIVNGVKQGLRSKYEVPTVKNVNSHFVDIAVRCQCYPTYFFPPPSLFYVTISLTLGSFSISSLYVHACTHTHTHTHSLLDMNPSPSSHTSWRLTPPTLASPTWQSSPTRTQKLTSLKTLDTFSYTGEQRPCGDWPRCVRRALSLRPPSWPSFYHWLARYVRTRIPRIHPMTANFAMK